LRNGTAETELKGSKARVSLDLDGSGKISLQSGSAFLDHMLHAFSRTASLDLEAEAGAGIFRLEALGAVLGRALSDALKDRSGIRRYGSAAVPMDEALAEAALDFSGRPYLIFAAEFQGQRIGDLQTQDIKPFLEAVCVGARLTLHVRCYGENDHHMAESIFKALGFAVKQAAAREGSGVPSTKGVI
jgi:imidazoleglycerol phosphate dehydratase HisB